MKILTGRFLVSAVMPAIMAMTGLPAHAGEPIKFEKPPMQDLQARVLDIFDTSCAYAGCHVSATAPENLDLSEETFMMTLINVNSGQVSSIKRVRPGDPANSYLVMKIKGSVGIKGEKMPRGGTPLSSQQIATIEAWIKAMPAAMSQVQDSRKHKQAFPGWSLANLQSAETLDKGAFLYRIAHRFKSDAGKANFDGLFGIDGGAFMMTQLAFPLSHNLTLSFARQGLNSTFEIGAKWRFLRERTDGTTPLSAAIYTGVDWASVGGLPDPGGNGTLGRTDGERFAFFAQLPVTRQFGRLSLMAVPGILLNGNVTLQNEDALVTLGIGGRVAVSERYALFAEIVPILSGDGTALTVSAAGLRSDGGKLVYNDTFAAGVEIKAGGHVFHFLLTNSGGNLTNQYMSGGDLDFAGGDFRIGFNIYRILNYPF